MADARWERIKAAFEVVMAAPAHERGAAVERECAGDAELKREVESLLSVRTQAFVKTGGAAAALGEQATAPDSMIEKPGQMIGPYKLLQLIGEGGFGSVFMAEQDKPVQRRVALKIIKLGMDTKRVIARFEAERQALAMMDHPHIARVLDAGATETGRPYFVMELVKGEPITEYCDRNSLSIPDRLQLFSQVCHAVQHAHTKGIIHRDLKPSNILVSTHDGRPHAKVIDFGIAKATLSKLTEKTLFTEHKALIGTPEYMSPEQAEGSLDIDTRTDVYSLGVLLYELLTGSTPFSGRELRSAAYAEIQRIIREVEPEKPSTRLSQITETIATVAAHRRAEPRKLGTLVRGELDWIVMKALEKDRQRRYETANGLAMDVGRYLGGEVVVAAPPSAAYRARKFVRRHRGPVMAGAAVAAALSLGLVAFALKARAARRERDAAIEARAAEIQQRQAAEEARARAAAAEEEARTRATQLQQVSDFQASMLAQVDPTEAGRQLTEDVTRKFGAALEKSGLPEADRSGRIEAFKGQWNEVNATDAARELIDRTILRPAVEAVGAKFKDQPLVDARLRQVIAERYQDLGLYDAATPLQERALATRRLVLGEEHPDTLASVRAMADLLYYRGKLAEAEPYYREALERRRRVLGEDHPDTLTSINDMGAWALAVRNLPMAERYYREALERRRRVLGEDHPDTLTSINDMGVTLQAGGKLREAEPYLREALEKSRRVRGEDQPYTLTAIGNLGYLLQAMGRYAEAEPYCREAMERRRRVLGEDHPDTLHSINAIGELLLQQGKPGVAEPYFREALEKERRVLGEDHPRTLATLGDLGTVLSSEGRFAEAEPVYREALEKKRRVQGPEHPNTLGAIANLGNLLQSQGKFAEAEACYREALEVRRRVLGEEHPDTLWSINSMGFLLAAEGKLAEAEAYYREALDKKRRVLGEDHPDTLGGLNNLGVTLRDQGRLAEAEPYLREAMEKRRRVLGPEHPATLISTIHMGVLLREQGRFADVVDLLAPIESPARRAFTGPNAVRLGALLLSLGRARAGLGFDADRFALAEADLLEAHTIFVAARGEGHKDTRDCDEALAGMYEAWDKVEPGKGYDAKAAAWTSKAAVAEHPS